MILRPFASNWYIYRHVALVNKLRRWYWPVSCEVSISSGLEGPVFSFTTNRVYDIRIMWICMIVRYWSRQIQTNTRCCTVNSNKIKTMYSFIIIYCNLSYYKYLGQCIEIYFGYPDAWLQRRGISRYIKTYYLHNKWIWQFQKEF